MSTQQRQQQFNEMMQRAKTTPVYQQTPAPQQIPTQPSTVSPLPREPTSPVVQENNKIYVRSDYEVKSKTTEPTEAGTQTTYQIGPKNQTSPGNALPPEMQQQGFRGGVTGAFGVQPLANTPEKRAIALEAVTVIVAPAVAPAKLVGSIILGEVIGAGFSQVPNIINASQGQNVTVKEVVTTGLEGAALGAVFSYASLGAFRAVSALPRVGSMIVASPVGRVGINSAIGAGGGYVLSGGNIAEAGKGAAFGALFSLGGDYVARPIGNVIRSHLPEGFYGKVIPLERGPTTIGKTGEDVATFVSKPIESLGGKRLRVIADVTENPVGTRGVSTSSMVNEYVGTRIPTSHATLNPESFSLATGGKTILTGYPELGAGYRQSQQLYHFYSAPGSKDFVNVYGGYAGIGEGYSGQSKISFGGKSTALVTLDTEVNAGFLKGRGESASNYLTRTSELSGKTGIAQETILGYSMERQLITPAKYSRYNVELPGSAFVSEGKVGAFQIQEKPSGVIGKIPVLRTMFSKFTNLDVVLGRYEPTAEVPSTKVLDTQKYGSSYGKTINVSPSIGVINFMPTIEVKSSTKTDKLSSMFAISKNMSINSSSNQGSVSNGSVSKESLASKPSFPSELSMPNSLAYSSRVPSITSSPLSKVSQPSKPSTSVGSITSFPSFASLSNNRTSVFAKLTNLNFNPTATLRKSSASRRHNRHLWEFPVMEPSEAMKDWF
jgi:hypothetical protein